MLEFGRYSEAICFIIDMFGIFDAARCYESKSCWLVSTVCVLRDRTEGGRHSSHKIIHVASSAAT